MGLAGWEITVECLMYNEQRGLGAGGYDQAYATGGRMLAFWWIDVSFGAL